MQLGAFPTAIQQGVHIGTTDGTMGIAQVGMVVAGEQAVNRQLRESLQGLDIRRFVKVLSTLPTQGRIRENNIAYEPDNLSKVSELVYYRPVV